MCISICSEKVSKIFHQIWFFNYFEKVFEIKIWRWNKNGSAVVILHILIAEIVQALLNIPSSANIIKHTKKVRSSSKYMYNFKVLRRFAAWHTLAIYSYLLRILVGYYHTDDDTTMTAIPTEYNIKNHRINSRT